jgi:hypothetical protein
LLLLVDSVSVFVPVTCHARPKIAETSPVLCECDIPYFPDPPVSDDDEDEEVFEIVECCIVLLLLLLLLLMVVESFRMFCC